MSDKKETNKNKNEAVEIDAQIKHKKEKTCEKCKKSKEKELKKEIELLKTKNINLELQILNLKEENNKDKEAFLAQAQTFQSKAKDKVEEFKKEHKTKLDEEIEYIKKYATSKFFKEMIEPWLNLAIAVEFGEKQSNQDVKNYVIGFKMLLKQIDSIMESFGLTKITPSLEEKFDPETMEAIATIEKKDSTDKVVEVKKHGFKHHDRIIKPATVVISK